MFCTNCGNQVNDGSKFCPNCGEKITVMTVDDVQKAAAVESNAAPAQSAPAPAQYQESTPAPQYQQNAPAPQPVYQAPQYQQQTPQYQQQPYQQTQYAAPKAPVKRSNGPAVAGLVFGLLTLILFIIAAFACSGALDMAYRYNYYYNGVSMGTMAFIAGACYGLGCILFIFNLIFGIIGFVRGLKTKSKMAAGIIGFVLIFINLGLLIWEAYAYITFLVAIM